MSTNDDNEVAIDIVVSAGEADESIDKTKKKVKELGEEEKELAKKAKEAAREAEKLAKQKEDAAKKAAAAAQKEAEAIEAAARKAADNTKTVGKHARETAEEYDRSATAVKRSLGSMSDSMGIGNQKMISLIDASADFGDMWSRGGAFVGISAGMLLIAELTKYTEEQTAKLNAQEAVWDSWANKVQEASKKARDARSNAASRLAAFEDEQRIAFLERTGQVKFANEARAEAAVRALQAEDRLSQEVATKRGLELKAEIRLAEKRGQSTDELDREFSMIASIRRNERAALAENIAAEQKLAELRTGYGLSIKNNQGAPKPKADAPKSMLGDNMKALHDALEKSIGADEETNKMRLDAIMSYRDNLLALNPIVAKGAMLFTQAELDKQRAMRETNTLAKQLSEETAAAQARAAADFIKSTKQMGLEVGRTFLGSGISAVQQFAIASATAQEDAAQAAAASFLSSIGSNIVGVGTQAIWEGLVMLPNPVTAPFGAAKIAIGTAAVAAGIGMGAAGAAMAKPPGAATSSGSVRSADKDRGTRGSSGSSGSSGNNSGGIVINNNYGLGVPREKVARDLNEQMTVAKRRNGSSLIKPRGN